MSVLRSGAMWAIVLPAGCLFPPRLWTCQRLPDRERVGGSFPLAEWVWLLVVGRVFFSLHTAVGAWQILEFIFWASWDQLCRVLCWREWRPHPRSAARSL